MMKAWLIFLPAAAVLTITLMAGEPPAASEGAKTREIVAKFQAALKSPTPSFRLVIDYWNVYGGARGLDIRIASAELTTDEPPANGYIDLLRRSVVKIKPEAALKLVDFLAQAGFYESAGDVSQDDLAFPETTCIWLETSAHGTGEWHKQLGWDQHMLKLLYGLRDVFEPGDPSREALAKLLVRLPRGVVPDAFLLSSQGARPEKDELQYSPPLPQTQPAHNLDAWFDALKKMDLISPTAQDENWLLFRTKQMNDHDRVWIEKDEHDGQQFMVTMHRADYRGEYKKNQTYHAILGVKLGKLPPGEYKAKWLIEEYAYEKFDPDFQPKDLKRAVNKLPVELSIMWTVVEAAKQK